MTMSTPINDIPGIGPATAAVLKKHGFHTAEDIASGDIKSLQTVPGFGPVKAKTTLATAKKLVGTAPSKKKAAGKSEAKSKSKKSKQKSKKKDKKSAKSGKKEKKEKSDKKGKSKKKKGGKKKKK